MSSHHRRAGTAKWTTASSCGGWSGVTFNLMASPQQPQEAMIRDDSRSMTGTPSASQAQLAK